MTYWSNSTGAEGLQSFLLLLCGTAKGSVSLHAGVSGGSPFLAPVGTWSCLWEKRNRKAQAASGGKVAETASSDTFCKETGLDEKDCGQLAAGFPSRDRKARIGHYPWRGSLGRAVPIGLDFPPGSAYLAAPASRSLAPDQAVAPGEAALAACHRGCCGLGTGFSLGKLLLPRSFCFLIGKLKFLGKTCRFCRKSFLVKESL